VKKKTVKSLLLTLAVATGMLAACSGGDQANTSSKGGTIKIGGLFDITGATGDVGAPYAEGEKAYFEYINSKGTINGYKLELKI